MQHGAISRRAFIKGTASLAAASAIGVPELAWREAWAGTSTGGTTVSRTITGTGGIYQKLAYGPGEPYLLREDLGVVAQPGRPQRRTPLMYFGQLSDTHVLDSQSPARVEYLDPIQAGYAAFRAQETLTPFVLDSMVRRINALQYSELSGARLAFTINTGDTTDNRQYNELRWVIDILDGGQVQLRSGSESYRGVQRGNSLPNYYHPDQPLVDSYGQAHDFPAYPGLLDSVELPLPAEGLRMPWYAVLGNHDGLVQGNVPAIPAFERIATGRIKIIGFPFGPAQQAQIARDLLRGDARSWKELLDWADTHRDHSFVMLVPADERRRLVSHQEWINEHFNTRGQPVGHGFSAENVKSDTGYYTFDPAPDIHCVALDTVNPAGGANGNLDETQFQWLDRDLTEHAEMITIIFAHHTIGTMDNEKLRPNDPRPPRLGADLEKLFWAHPSVVAFVNGHTHVNAVIPHPKPSPPGTGFWEVNTAAHIDWPEQSRLIEIFDNHDGTISIFGAIVDHVAAPDTPSLTPSGLATISRELAFNDPQIPPSVGSGTPMDRNVELILAAPLRS